MTACQTLDPDLWFENTPSYDEHLALAACYACPLITPCLKIALAAEVTQRNTQSHLAGAPLDTAERFGIFGGLLPWQRTVLAMKDHRNAALWGVA